jgi:hypothetical protein
LRVQVLLCILSFRDCAVSGCYFAERYSIRDPRDKKARIILNAAGRPRVMPEAYLFDEALNNAHQLTRRADNFYCTTPHQGDGCTR